jgi:putative (di)nucleoside polyphosphate hydrolase|tara:strand:+ start:245 stop:715 length:471 start_codon:yes stop_codon:yes gene_type:complete
MQNEKLPLRIGVGIVVLNSKNEVLVAKRKDNPLDKWQMPQGGVEKDEDFITSMYRELLEETSITSIKIIKEFDYWLEYLLPDHLVGIIWKGKYRGQKQKWFIVRFTGNENEININTKNPEFIEWKWLKIKELTNVVVSFKKSVYEKILIELEKITD